MPGPDWCPGCPSDGIVLTFKRCSAGPRFCADWEKIWEGGGKRKGGMGSQEACWLRREDGGEL